MSADVGHPELTERVMVTDASHLPSAGRHAERVSGIQHSGSHTLMTTGQYGSIRQRMLDTFEPGANVLRGAGGETPNQTRHRASSTARG